MNDTVNPEVLQQAQPVSPMARYARTRYLEYAMSVVTGRALPQVEDGLKPVQRRILFAMHQMRLGNSAKHVKSARVVGDVIGKYHPHGDSSVYDAAVRVAQDFSLRYPLVDGQGSFGSRDGDSAAAMRYTEMRLAPITELLLAEIGENTVDFLPNYDGAFEEPARMPARLPFMLLNGASGIAVGMATEMPSHNLREVADAVTLLIRNPGASLDDVMACMPGPDLPTGGQIISPVAAIREAYDTGRGSLRVRARWRVEELARGHWRIIVSELPQGVSCAQVAQEVEALVNPQPKAGKKELSVDQKNLKALFTGLLDRIRDESCKDEPLRFVIEPKSRTQKADELMQVLFAHTSLESPLSINMTYLDCNRTPGRRGLLAVLTEWIGFRRATITRRTQHRLDAVSRRIHILEGRQIVFLNLDEVIHCIRESDAPKDDLMARFGLTEIQAEDILEIRLRQLARLEGFALEKELAELRENRAGLELLLNDAQVLTRQMLKEVAEDSKRFGDERRTLIEEAQSARPADLAEVMVSDDPVTVVVSKNGWLRTRNGHDVDLATLAFKEGDGLLAAFRARTSEQLILLDTMGRSFSLPVHQLPGGRSDGVPASSMLELSARVAAAITGKPTDRVLVAGRGGYGFQCTIAEMISRNKAGKAFLTLEADEAPLAPLPLTDAMVEIVCLSAGGKGLCFPLEEVKVLPKGKGVKLMDFAAKDNLAAIVPVIDEQAEGVPDGRLKALRAGRGGKGKKVL